MSKIVKAINVMVSNPELITNVIEGYNSSECFFTYDNKHNWSILLRSDGHYFLAYYPGQQNMEEIAGIPDEHWEDANIKYVPYNSKDLGTVEAVQSMADLYSIVKEKVFGMDLVLADIIESDSDF